MIDLRSDTLTRPTEKMRKAMYSAEVGDDARIDPNGQGEDPTVRALEELTCEITGKEAALFCNSGTMANYISLLTNCKRGEKVLLSANSHIYRSETALFTEQLFGLKPLFYDENKYGVPYIDDIENILQTEDISLLCLENTSNFYGGTCISQKKVDEIRKVARSLGIPVYLDGARIFNASVALGESIRDLCVPVDSLMFCLSKGLGAPVGSVLCGRADFIRDARKIRKRLGGAMRQAGVIAAAGIVALEHYNESLIEDHQNALFLAERIESNSKVSIDYQSVQTNIVKIDISNSGLTVQKMEEDLLERGLKVKSMSNRFLRLTVYNGVDKKQINQAADILNKYVDGIM